MTNQPDRPPVSMFDALGNGIYISEEDAAKNCKAGFHDWSEFGEGPECFCLHCGATIARPGGKVQSPRRNKIAANDAPARREGGNVKPKWLDRLCVRLEEYQRWLKKHARFGPLSEWRKKRGKMTREELTSVIVDWANLLMMGESEDREADHQILRNRIDRFHALVSAGIDSEYDLPINDLAKTVHEVAALTNRVMGKDTPK